MFTLAALTAVAGSLIAVPTPLRLTADVEDVYALRANPSALGFLDAAELRLVYGNADPDLYAPASSGSTNGFGIFGAVPLWRGLVLGASLEADVDQDDRTAAHYAIGLGWAGRTLAIGLSYENRPRFAEPGLGMVNLGFSARLASWLAAGLTIHDLAQHAQRREWDLGLALRLHPRFTLSSSWRLTQDESLNADTLDLRFLASTEPIDGLLIGVGTDVDLSLFFSLGLSFGGFGIGGAVNGVGGDPAFVAEMTLKGDSRRRLVKPSGVAVLELAGDLKPDTEFSLLRRKAVVHAYGALPLALEAMRTSDAVRGVFVRIGSLDVGWGTAAEVHRGLKKIKDDGRRVDCQLLGQGDLAYFIATACTSVIVTPPQMVEVNGVAADVLFFGEALDNLGVHVEVVRRGDYKSSPEQLTRSGMSRPHREALGAYLDTVYDTLVDGIVEGRKMNRDDVVALLDNGTFTSSEAVASKLVDQRLYPDEIEDHLRTLHGSFARFIPAGQLLERQPKRWTDRDGVAIIHVDAIITSGESTDMPFGFGRTAGAQTLLAAIESARLRSDIRAVVLRVDSPGGDAVASDLVARAVRKLAAAKPVVASFGDVAASGGYYVAADAKAIFAEPTTLTGSIGVFSMTFAFERLLADLGIHASVVGRGENANIRSMYVEPDAETRRVIAKGVDDAYGMFLDTVAAGRPLDRAAVKDVAEGRIWSGRDAKNKGLVDELGGLHDAISHAKVLAGFRPDAKIRLVTLPRTREPLPEPVRTVVEVLTPRFDAAGSLATLLPPPVIKALQTLYAPWATAPRGQPLALAPWRILVR